ncbi:MAG: tetratricopeptide repeat protein [Burkholderia gladioli]|uniref:tetratricopeptide repeat protein n=1 Tax=Burkholderia gladioli TaxID=28095 RepID=UPI00163F0CC2|nr:tetratricopeptide repeat protein [Burkholderia gladioli]
MKKFVAAAGIALLVASASVFAAVPSLQQVIQSINQQNWQRADSQLSQVIAAHPDNARAHYLYGQVLDREGRPADALAAIERARSLDPTLHFTTPSAFAQTESRLRADANRASGERRSATAGGALMPSATPPSAMQTSSLAPAAKPAHHGPGMIAWLGLIAVIVVVVLVLRRTLNRSRAAGNQEADNERRAQLKRATDLLNEVRPLKLDARISTAPGASALTGEIEAVESDALGLVETLSKGKNPVAPYQVEELERRFASLKARVEGRPDPNAAPAAPAAASGSAFAQEADRLSQPQQPYPPSYQPYPPQSPYPPQPQQPPVIVQQGGGFGGGMGGLLTGVLLGEALSGGRERVVERDVIVDDQRQRSGGGGFDLGNNGGGNDAGFDVGQGDSWSTDSGDSGSVDLGSNDDDWNNS